MANDVRSSSELDSFRASVASENPLISKAKAALPVSKADMVMIAAEYLPVLSEEEAELNRSCDAILAEIELLENELLQVGIGLGCFTEEELNPSPAPKPDLPRATFSVVEMIKEAAQ
ncbi:hypothetical protein [Terasakiella sp. SH-1]|uniref:hypothetical protein n=1 Tax=Terasakiella sp. SH-1 TaxID=2560057 RepID=UPI0010740584|nr:hypothetical protein [Terasakiella sp. SH-1]